MKKEHAYLILCMLFFCEVFSQNDTVYWSGKVRDSHSGEPIKNAHIHLKLSNGGMHEALSNDSGYYLLKLKTVFEKGELSVVTDKNTHIVNRKTNGFIASKEMLSFTFPKEKCIVYDFTLNRSPVCWLNKMPSFWFAENSTAMVPYQDPDSPDSSVMAPDEVIDFYYELLDANPEIVVELKGRCDQPEKNRQVLSEKRAQVIASKLIAKGIPTTRLMVRGVGYPAPTHVTDSDLKQTEEEKKLAHLKNRSVGIRIVNWDYVDPKAPKKRPGRTMKAVSS